MGELDMLIKMVNQVRDLIKKDLSSYLSGGATNNFNDYLMLLKQFEAIMNSNGIGVDDYHERCDRLAGLFAGIEKKEENVCKIKLDVESLMDEITYKAIEKKQQFCIIQRNDVVPGLASHIITNLGHMAACIKEGKIPVVDMIGSENGFSELSRSCGKNAWELFFEQSYGVELEKIPKDMIIDTKVGIPAEMPSYDMEFLTNDALVNKWRGLCHLHMRPSCEIISEIEKVKVNTPFSQNKRILGVLCRGTDYVQKRPFNHPVQPKPWEVIEKAKAVMHEQNCEYCYLATEDKEIVELFKKELGEKVFTSQQIYYENPQGKMLSEVNEETGTDVYGKNVEYLTALYLLAECDCFIGGRTSGTVAVLLFADGFDYFYTWNKGRYGKSDILSV